MQPIQANLHWATDIHANLHNSAMHFQMLRWEATHNSPRTTCTVQQDAPIQFGKKKKKKTYLYAVR